MKYHIEFAPNTNVIEIHVDKRLIKGTIASFEPDDLEDSTEELRKEAKDPENLFNFCRTVTELDGMVGSISFGRYDVQFEKATMFDWSKLIPAILDAFRTFIAGGPLEEEKPPKLPTAKELKEFRRQLHDFPE